MFYACSWILFLTFKEVSDCCTLPYFMPAHHACSWLSRLWVAICLPIVYTCLWCLFLALQFVSGYCALPYSYLVMMPVLGSPACEWLLYPALFYAFSWCLFLAYQKVSGYSALPYFMLAHDACFWPSRKWVPCHISCLTMCYETSIFIFFLDYWQVTLIWSPYGDASLIRSLLIGDTSTTYYTDVATRVMMTLY